MAQTAPPSRRPRKAAPPTAEPVAEVALEAPEVPLEADPVPRPKRVKPVSVATAVLLVLAALLLVGLGAQERGGPDHIDLSIGDGIPATLYVPGDSGQGFPLQRPKGERPPVVVIAHGYSADRRTMSSMARSLAEAGYAALAFDFRGHGDSESSFRGALRDDLDAVLDELEISPYVDGKRIAVLGHSMGAGAALDFGTIDPRPLALIPVSGGWSFNDVHIPPKVLFLVAARDPGFIHDRQEDLARELGTVTDVTSFEIANTDHGTILWSGETIRQVVGFLDPVFGVERASADAVGIEDPRLGTALLYLLAVLGLIGMLGLAVGRTVTPIAPSGTPAGLVLVALALLVSMPLLATGGPAILPLGAGQPVAVHLALAGALLWAARLYARRGVLTGRAAAWLGTGAWLPLRSVGWPALAAGLAIFLLVSPLGVVFHRMVPSVTRAVLWIVVAALVLPFFAAFEAIVRRGSTRAAIGWGALGRLVLLVVLLIGVGLQVLPGVIALVIPVLVFQYVVLEVFAATCYATGRNPAVIAVVDAVFMAWWTVTLTPIG